MKSAVILKGNKFGFEIVLNPDLPFEEINRTLSEKMRDSSQFFREGKKIAVSFTGRILTPEEQNQLVDTIISHSTLSVTCVIDGAKSLEECYFKVLTQVEEQQCEKEQPTGELFYRGTLFPGEILEVDRSIIILGDVLLGSKIISKGNITVLGTLRGRAHAGYPNRNNAYIAALNVKTAGLRIGRVGMHLIQSLCFKKLIAEKQKKRKAQIILVENETLCVDDIMKSLIREVRIS